MKEYVRFRWIKGNNVLFKRLGIILLAFFTFLGCAKQRPPDVLSQEEMVKALSEVYLTEEKVNRLNLSRDSGEKVYQYFNDKLFEKLGVTDSTFKRSLGYYQGQPKEMEKIYAALIDSLNLREQRLSIPTQ